MITKCPKCNIEFENAKNKYIKKFCSRKCSNSRIFSEESKKKKSIALKGCKGRPLSKEHKIKLREGWINRKQHRKQIILSLTFDQLTYTEQRERLLREQNFCCKVCGIEQVWNGQPLKFERDHISGDRTDNSRENLRMICPNCHSQTETYKSKNATKQKITDEKFIEALKTSESIYKALTKLNMNLHGGNYTRARNIIRKYDLQIAYLLI